MSEIMNPKKILTEFYYDDTFPIDMLLIIARNNIYVKFEDRFELGGILKDNDKITFYFNSKYENFIFGKSELSKEFKYIAATLFISFYDKHLDFIFKLEHFNSFYYMNLAGKLLIPALFIDYLVENDFNRIETVEKMSETFGVSYNLALNRCINLDMI